jgi:hypothetical protein
MPSRRHVHDSGWLASGGVAPGHNIGGGTEGQHTATIRWLAVKVAAATATSGPAARAPAWRETAGGDNEAGAASLLGALCQQLTTRFATKQAADLLNLGADGDECLS